MEVTRRLQPGAEQSESFRRDHEYQVRGIVYEPRTDRGIQPPGPTSGDPRERYQASGELYAEIWDAQHLSSGVYFYRFEATADGRTAHVFNRKMTLLK